VPNGYKTVLQGYKNILENTVPPRGEILADVIWGKKYEKKKRKRGKMYKKKEERGKKMRKGEVKG
jgi:hypothetical protein